jgi:predicted MFS family arabinose efflux permease
MNPFPAISIVLLLIGLFVFLGKFFESKEGRPLSPKRLRAARLLILALATIAIVLRLKAMLGH